MGRRREARPQRSPLRTWLHAAYPDASVRPTPERLAEQWGCSRTTIYGLLDGTRRPSVALAARIERETGGAVRASAWATVKPRRWDQ